MRHRKKGEGGREGDWYPLNTTNARQRWKYLLSIFLKTAGMGNVLNLFLQVWEEEPCTRWVWKPKLPVMPWWRLMCEPVCMVVCPRACLWVYVCCGVGMCAGVCMRTCECMIVVCLCKCVYKCLYVGFVHRCARVHRVCIQVCELNVCRLWCVSRRALFI